MIVAIYAFENTYGGLYGIEHHRIVEVDNIEQAERIAIDDSIEVMYWERDIIEDFEITAEAEGFEPGSEDFDICVSECINNNIAYNIWEIVDCYDTIEQMEKDFYNDMDDFVQMHCKEIE